MSFNEGKITLTFFFFCVRATILGTQDQAEITSNTSLVLKKVAPFLLKQNIDKNRGSALEPTKIS